MQAQQPIIPARAAPAGTPLLLSHRDAQLISEALAYRLAELAQYAGTRVERANDRDTIAEIRGLMDRINLALAFGGEPR